MAGQMSCVFSLDAPRAAVGFSRWMAGQPRYAQNGLYGARYWLQRAFERLRGNDHAECSTQTPTKRRLSQWPPAGQQMTGLSELGG